MIKIIKASSEIGSANYSYDNLQESDGSRYYNSCDDHGLYNLLRRGREIVHDFVMGGGTFHPLQL